MKKQSLAFAFLLYRYSAWITRLHGPVLILSFLTALIGTFYSVKLYQNLRTDIEELLPENVQSVRDLKAVANRVGGLNHLSIVIETRDRMAGRRFAEDLALGLQKLPPSLVARVQHHIKSEREFFEKNRALYVDLNDWNALHRYALDRIRYERKNKNPFSLGLEDDGAASAKSLPKFDFEALRQKYEGRANQVDRFPDGYFESKDGKIHVVLAFLPGKVTDIGSNQKLSDVAHELVDGLRPKTYAPDMVVGFSGDVQNVVEEHRSIVEDLVKSSIIVSLLVGLVLLLFFSCISGVLALCVSLVAGTAWTFGLSYFVVGYLNANTAFLGSIVIGNGINFGIIFLARYFEERQAKLGHSLPDIAAVLRRSIGYTAEATWTAALAAGLAYASLGFTEFRGFNQFGVIGGIGMVLCWISAFTTLPALLVFLEKHKWLRIPLKKERKPIAHALSVVVARFHKPILLVTLIAVAAAAVSTIKFSKVGFIETDFTKLRNKNSMTSGSGFWDKRANTVFERYLTPTAVLSPTNEDALKIAKTLKERKSEEGDSSIIADVKTIEDFIPGDQSEKLHVMDEINKLLTVKVLARLSSEERKLVHDLLPGSELRPITISSLPDGVSTHFKELDGTLGRMVHVYPRLGRFWDANEVIQFTRTLREDIERSKGEGIVAGQAPLSADMITAIMKDGPKATLFAFVSVLMLVIVVFGQPRYVGFVIVSLLTGVCWMTGLMAGLGLKINFLNFIALPITFGIGIDYAVNIVSRYKNERADQAIRTVLENTGGAVVLCSITTIIGYGSLLIASNQAFVSFGKLAVLGELTCLLAAIFVLPAIWAHLSERIAGKAPKVGHLPSEMSEGL